MDWLQRRKNKGLRIVKKIDMKNVESPNFWKTRASQRIKGVVIHVSGKSYDDAIKCYLDPESGKSNHLVISKTGDVTKMVNYQDSALHIDKVYYPKWKGVVDGISPNRTTIGIECEGERGETWTEPQMKALCVCVKEILASAELLVSRYTIVSPDEIASDAEGTKLWANEVVERLTGHVEGKKTPPKEKLEKVVKLLNEVLEEGMF